MADKSARFKVTQSMNSAKRGEFRPLLGFGFGYHSMEDVTTLDPRVMVSGSQNVLTSVKGTIQSRKGYTLDGARNKDGSPVLASYDWITHLGLERNLRLTGGQLQYRYVSGSTVTWRDLFPSSGTGMNFSEFWDFSHELKSLLLFVDGTSNVFMWSGGVTEISGTTANTISIASGTWASIGFLNTGTYAQKVVINGNEYAYTGGADTATLTGVTPDPSGEAVGSVAHQKVVTTANSSISGIPATFANNLIATVKNQIYLTGKNNNSIYVSKANSFTDFTFSSPRKIGEGAILTLDAVPVALSPQDEEIYVSAGRDFWYQTKFSLSSDSVTEILSVSRLKTMPQQAAQSQGLVAKIKNKLVFVSNEPVVNTLGLEANILSYPQVKDISYPIVNDMNAYDFTGGHMVVWRKNLYVTVPRHGLTLVYNMTSEDLDPATSEPKYYWEAPLTMPFSRLAIIGGWLYGHSSTDGQTFRLFDGWNDDGHSVLARISFAYSFLPSRNLRKSSDELFVEGYISQNTTVKAALRRELGGQKSYMNSDIFGTDPLIVNQIVDDASLGKVPLGEGTPGSSSAVFDSGMAIPKFRVYLTYPRTPYFDEQASFESDGIDQRWELVSYATNSSVTTEEPADITK